MTNKVSGNLSARTTSSVKGAGKAFAKPAVLTGEQDLQSLPGQKDLFSSPAGAEGGFDLTQVPVGPGLRTSPRVQLCSKDSGSCSCPKCQAAANDTSLAGDQEEGIGETAPEEQGGETAATMSSTAETASAAEETSAEETSAGTEEATPAAAEGAPATAEPSAGAETEAERSTQGLLVEDSATDLQAGQMKKTQFLQLLRESICSAIDPLLARAGRSSEGCPYLNYWMDLYQQKDAEHIEQAARKYAPDTAGAKTAEGYISVIAQRAMKAAEIWVETGKLSGVPEGVPTTIPGQPAPVEAGQGNILRAKAKSGGVKRADDPQAIQKDLGEGQPLATEVRSRMESAFGTSFSHVRAHTDANASDLSNHVNARAFTVGNHVAFGNGEYRPGTVVGDALIAHELAHTIQQGGADSAKADTGGYEALENDADKTSVSAISSLYGNAKNILSNAAPRLRSGLKLQRCGGKSTPVCANPGNERSVELQPVFFKDSAADASPTGKSWTKRFNAALPIWSKLGITFTAKAAVTLEDATNKTAGSTDAELIRIMGLQTGDGIEIFMVDNDIAHQGGAGTVSKGADSQTVLSDKGTSDTLLAHELGHVLGLGHPPSDADDNTVMKPTNSHSVNNPTRNTMVNYNKITWPAAGKATCLNPDT